MNVIGHTPARFKRSNGVNLNGILGCKPLSKNAHRTHQLPRLCSQPDLHWRGCEGGWDASANCREPLSLWSFPIYLQSIQRGATGFMVRNAMATCSLVLPHLPSVFGWSLRW
jgi:hypothetical protein